MLVLDAFVISERESDFVSVPFIRYCYCCEYYVI